MEQARSDCTIELTFSNWLARQLAAFCAQRGSGSSIEGPPAYKRRIVIKLAACTDFGILVGRIGTGATDVRPSLTGGDVDGTRLALNDQTGDAGRRK